VEETTGPEIWRDTDGAVDVLVGAVGTGGTISGTGRFLKSQKPGLKVVVVEPTPDALPSAQCPYAENIEGVHKVTEVPGGDLPANYGSEIVDEVVPVNVGQAKEAALALARDEGILAGPSGGAVLFAALALSVRPEYADQTIVMVIPDSGVARRCLRRTTRREAARAGPIWPIQSSHPTRRRSSVSRSAPMSSGTQPWRNGR
jgi:cysteine synthase A